MKTPLVCVKRRPGRSAIARARARALGRSIAGLCFTRVGDIGGYDARSHASGFITRSRQWRDKVRALQDGGGDDDNDDDDDDDDAAAAAAAAVAVYLNFDTPRARIFSKVKRRLCFGSSDFLLDFRFSRVFDSRRENRAQASRLISSVATTRAIVFGSRSFRRVSFNITQ